MWYGGRLKVLGRTLGELFVVVAGTFRSRLRQEYTQDRPCEDSPLPTWRQSARAWTLKAMNLVLNGGIGHGGMLTKGKQSICSRQKRGDTSPLKCLLGARLSSPRQWESDSDGPQLQPSRTSNRTLNRPTSHVRRSSHRFRLLAILNSRSHPSDLSCNQGCSFWLSG